VGACARIVRTDQSFGSFGGSAWGNPRRNASRSDISGLGLNFEIKYRGFIALTRSGRGCVDASLNIKFREEFNLGAGRPLGSEAAAQPSPRRNVSGDHVGAGARRGAPEAFAGSQNRSVPLPIGSRKPV